MFRSLIWPLSLTVLLAGCSVEGEVDYDRTQNRSAIERAATQADGVQNQVVRDKDHSGLHVSWKSSIGSDHREERSIAAPTQPVPQPPPVVAKERTSQMINIGDINLHLGDIQNHEHIHLDQSVKMSVETPKMQGDTPAPSSSPDRRQTAILNERCERLRREYEARLAQWSLLFEGP